MRNLLATIPAQAVIDTAKDAQARLLTWALLPPVVGVSVGLGIAAALAAFPGGTLMVAGLAGVTVGVLAWAASRFLPRRRVALPSGGDEEDWVDDGSGERPGWSGHHTRGDLSAFSAWAHGDRELDPDATGVMPAPTWDVPGPDVADGADQIRPYQPRHLAKVGDQ